MSISSGHTTTSLPVFGSSKEPRPLAIESMFSKNGVVVILSELSGATVLELFDAFCGYQGDKVNEAKSISGPLDVDGIGPKLRFFCADDEEFGGC